MGHTVRVHHHAVVHNDAVLGSNVEIGPFAVVEHDVVIGNNTSIQAHAHIRAGARIGEDCEIFTGASVGAVPQDLKFDGEPSTAKIGDRTVIREYATVHRGTDATGNTEVGSDCLLMAYTHVAHDCRVGDHVILANGVQLGGHVRIDEWAILGGLTGVHQFERVGKHAMIGAGFRVMKDVPPFALAGNEPLGFSGVNVIGLERRGFSKGTIDAIRQAYRTIYRSGRNISDGIAAAGDLAGDHDEVRDIIQFIRNSERGVIPLSR